MANIFDLEFGGQTAVVEVTGVRVPNAVAKVNANGNFTGDITPGSISSVIGA
jgi:hypothetical protein